MKNALSKNAWVVKWREPGIDGYTDYFPSGAFGAPANRITHLVIGPRGWRGIAACSVSPVGNVVDLDYGAFAAPNRAAGMEVGVLRLQFDPKGNSIVGARWNGNKASVEASIGLPPELPPYQPKAGKRRRITIVAARGPQAKFRTSVRAVYGDKCAITGCDISEALEAAHIDPFENPSQHHPSNGVLLRRDLHALFDRGLIAIESVASGAHVVHVHPTLHRCGEYKALDKQRLRPPEDGFSAYSPTEKAISRRWADWHPDAAV